MHLRLRLVVLAFAFEFSFSAQHTSANNGMALNSINVIQ